MRCDLHGTLEGRVLWARLDVFSLGLLSVTFLRRDARFQ